ncbi:ABC transporter permease, partial [candidate division KSB1 bacterium]
LAVLISGLGFLGLSSYIIEQRTKEIGIRKTLGASFSAILTMLAKEFFKYLLYANFIALPVAYWIMTKWLQNFAYHTDLSMEIFVLTCLSSIIIVMLSAGYQSLKAACANPIDSLNYE